MNEKDTFELDQVLGKTHLSEVTDYLKEQADSMLVGNRPFGTYMKSIIRRNKIKLQDVFLSCHKLLLVKSCCFLCL